MKRQKIYRMPTRRFLIEQFSAMQLDQVLPRLQAVLDRQQTAFYFLGGLARDMLLLSEGKSALRITRDIDVAVFTPDPATFFAIKQDQV